MACVRRSSSPLVVAILSLAAWGACADAPTRDARLRVDPVTKASDAGVHLDGDPSEADASGDASGAYGGEGVSSPCTGERRHFSTDVSPLLKERCSGERCHGGLASGAWPYDSLVGVHATRDTCAEAGLLVVAGHPEASYLVNKLTGIGMCPETARMPTGEPLPPADIQAVVDWICDGAQDD